MPVADTELLFALNPNDHKHPYAMKLLAQLKHVVAPDTAILEFQIVLRARGRRPSQVKLALLALREALRRSGVREARTISTDLLALQCELEDKHGMSFFDSLIAASALVLDREIISDDEAFDKVPDLRRIPLSDST